MAVSPPRLPDTASPITTVHEFNARAQNVSEVEIKFLVTNRPADVFANIENYFRERDQIRSEIRNKQLLSRQLDVAERTLASEGTSIRIRGDCVGGDLHRVSYQDICLKTGKTRDESGAIRRGEYEAPVASFNTVDLDALQRKYPTEDYPELHQKLEGIAPEALREFFRIDCIRNRFIIELPEAVTGLVGRRYVAELILDDVAFVLDVPGFDEPIPFARDYEIESESLFKPCTYDANPEAARYVSSPLNQAEANQAMAAMKREIRSAAGLPLEINEMSKAERGFISYDRFMQAIRNHLAHRQPETEYDPQAFLAPAFRGGAHPTVANNDNHAISRCLSEIDLAAELRNFERATPIACYTPDK